MKVLISGVIACALFQNCHKESYEPRNDFKADLLVKRLICYPNDSISLSFELLPKDGNGSYSYQWMMPDTMKGSGPFTVNLNEDLKILVKIRDAKSKQLDYTHIIQKDTIDSLKYDYRNHIIGNYICDYQEWYPTSTDSGWVHIRNKYRDTLIVYKSEVFNNIACNIFNELTFNRKTNKFTYEWGSVFSSIYVVNDSVYFGHSRLARYGLSGKGKKMTN
ncbi:MAG TPA: hypothetical protein VFG54_04115 [Prolixibacteraceae bacterium]|nr:hypothetical protein [Prolixibacteraceae bacterium]